MECETSNNLWHFAEKILNWCYNSYSYIPLYLETDTFPQFLSAHSESCENTYQRLVCLNCHTIH